MKNGEESYLQYVQMLSLSTQYFSPNHGGALLARANDLIGRASSVHTQLQDIKAAVAQQKLRRRGTELYIRARCDRQSHGSRCVGGGCVKKYYSVLETTWHMLVDPK